jgi:hypothetical protein
MYLNVLDKKQADREEISMDLKILLQAWGTISKDERSDSGGSSAIEMPRLAMVKLSTFDRMVSYS